MTAAVRQRRNRPLRERLMERIVVTSDGCWEWQGARTRDGYGCMSVGGRAGISGRTHRISWELANGPIPPGGWVLHSCDNPPCCNPDHLFLGDATVNVRDMVTKGRNKRSVGQHVSSAKLTDAQVVEIRRRYDGGERVVDIVRDFPVTYNHLLLVARRKKRITS